MVHRPDPWPPTRLHEDLKISLDLSRAPQGVLVLTPENLCFSTDRWSARTVGLSDTLQGAEDAPWSAGMLHWPHNPWAQGRRRRTRHQASLRMSRTLGGFICLTDRRSMHTGEGWGRWDPMPGPRTARTWCLSFSTQWSPHSHVQLLTGSMEKNTQGLHNTKPHPGAHSSIHSVRGKSLRSTGNMTTTGTKAMCVGDTT